MAADVWTPARSRGGGRVSASADGPGRCGPHHQAPTAFWRMVVVCAPRSLAPAAGRPRRRAGPCPRAAHRGLGRPAPLAARRGDPAGSCTVASERPITMFYFTTMLFFLPSSSTS